MKRLLRDLETPSQWNQLIFTHNHYYSPLLKTKRLYSHHQKSKQRDGDKSAMISAPVWPLACTQWCHSKINNAYMRSDWSALTTLSTSSPQRAEQHHPHHVPPHTSHLCHSSGPQSVRYLINLTFDLPRGTCHRDTPTYCHVSLVQGHTQPEATKLVLMHTLHAHKFGAHPQAG